jgi:hypothetical protein
MAGFFKDRCASRAGDAVVFESACFIRRHVGEAGMPPVSGSTGQRSGIGMALLLQRNTTADARGAETKKAPRCEGGALSWSQVMRQIEARFEVRLIRRTGAGTTDCSRSREKGKGRRDSKPSD